MIAQKQKMPFREAAGQRGVTLILAILVLASVLAISFSLATILFAEVRSSGDLLRTETSYYGAAGVGEQALYNLKRKVNQNPNNGNQCDQSLPNCYSPAVGGSIISGTQPTAIADRVQQDSIPPSSGLTNAAGSLGFSPLAKEYLFYDPSHPTAGSGYSKITLTYLSPAGADHLQVYLCEFDPSAAVNTNYPTMPCSDPASSSGYWRAGFGGPAGGFDFYAGNSPYTINNLDATKQQALIVFNCNNNGGTNCQSTGPVYIQITAFDSNGQAKGIPYFQQSAVDINAQNSNVGRKLRIKVPND